MSEPEQPSKPLPADDSIIVKLPRSTRITNLHVAFDAANSPILISTNEFKDKVAEVILQQMQPKQLWQQGIQVEILEPEKKWVTGKIRLRLVFEFVPDKPENKTPSGFVSPLEDIRNMNTEVEPR